MDMIMEGGHDESSPGGGASGAMWEWYLSPSDSDSTNPPTKRVKGRSKVWEKVAWFTRKAKGSRETQSEGGAMPDGGSLTDYAMDVDMSPLHSADDILALGNSSHGGWMESSSSSDEFFEFSEPSGVRKSQLYPNSEIDEQSCLKPSVARALFLQMDAARMNNNKPPKLIRARKKKTLAVSKSLDIERLNPESASSGHPCLPLSFSVPSDLLCVCNLKSAAPCPHRAVNPAKFGGQVKGQGQRDFTLARPGIVGHGNHNSRDIMPSTSILTDDNITPSNTENSEVCFQPAALSQFCRRSSLDDCLPMHTGALSPSQSPELSSFKYSSLPSYSTTRGWARLPGQNSYHRRGWGHLPGDGQNSHLGICDSLFHLASQAGPSVCNCQVQYEDCSETGEILNSVGDGSINDSDSNISGSNIAVRGVADVMKSREEVGPLEYKERKDKICSWFGEFNDEQKNILLKEILKSCELPQIHLLSVKVGPKLHVGCPPNCQDVLSWLPSNLSLYVLTFLDPVSLCRASQVCRKWFTLSNELCLWRHFCALPQWRLSTTGEQKQLINNILPDGTVHWKKVFAERYRLRNNWLKGRCHVRTFEGHTQGIICVQFDDTRIVSGSSDKTVKVWNIRTNTPWSVQTLVGHSGTVRCLHLDGNRLVSGSTDRTIKVWDLSTQQSWSSIACKVTMIGHTDTVRCLQVDEEKVISGSYDKTLKIWDIKTGQCRRTLRGHDAAVLCAQFDTRKIVSGSADKTIKIWTFDGGCLMTLEGHQDAVTCLQFDNNRIISGSLDCNLMFWDMTSGQCVQTIDWKAAEGHTRVVRCLQADSWRLVSASDDRTLKVWNLATGKRLVTLRHHTDGVTCLQFNDSVIVSGSYDKTVKLWDFSCV